VIKYTYIHSPGVSVSKYVLNDGTPKMGEGKGKNGSWSQTILSPSAPPSLSLTHKEGITREQQKQASSQDDPQQQKAHMPFTHAIIITA
jgi:hypothetical protein